MYIIRNCATKSITTEHVKMIRAGIIDGGDYLSIESDHVDSTHNILNDKFNSIAVSFNASFKPHLNAYNEFVFLHFPINTNVHLNT